MKKSFVYTFITTCISAIIGAGFASGRELTTFFANYGFWSILFIVLAGVLFFWCFYLFAKLGKIIQPKSISDITKAIYGNSHFLIDFIFILSAIITLSSMLAGCDSIGYLVFNENYNFCYISIFTAMIVAVIVSIGLKYIYKINNILLPVILVLLLAVLSVFLLVGDKQTVSSQYITFNGFSVLLSAFLYVSMNIFTNSFLIAKTSQYMDSKQIKKGSISTSIILVILIIFIVISILLGGNDVFLSDMPIISIAYNISNGFGICYAVVLWFAIFTTICISAFVVETWLNNFIENRFLCSVIVLTTGFIFSRFGFSTIVSVFYPLEGILGFVFIVNASVYYIKNKQKYNYELSIGKRDIFNNTTVISKNLYINLNKKSDIITDNKSVNIQNLKRVKSLSIEKKNGKVIRKRTFHKK